FARIPEQEQEEILARARLQMSIPALRARTLDNLLGTVDSLSAGLARRYGRDPSDLMIRTPSAAITGAPVPALVPRVGQHGRRRPPRRLLQGLTWPVSRPDRAPRPRPPRAVRAPGRTRDPGNGHARHGSDGQPPPSDADVRYGPLRSASVRFGAHPWPVQAPR